MISQAVRDRLRGSLLPNVPPNMLDWATFHVVIPDGPHKGQPFDADVQPFARLFLAEVDSGRWDRIVATGPTQSGKSLICYIVPVLYHLFAYGETVVAGLPSSDMADDKWAQDFLPVIEASPTLRTLLPTVGPGSRSGRVKTRVKFRNGATLRFLSGGGHDKSRAGFTGRVLAVTEVDGLDVADPSSREADKLKQMEARQRAFLQAGTRTYLECTVTTKTGRIWQEYTGGTQSRIARPCPQCRQYVTPEREQLTGWKQADDELQARAAAAWTCPACGKPWTESERYAANLQSVLVHRGQSVNSRGKVTGPIPPTRTLGFRWSAVDNHFATAADVVADEWQGTREADRENAEKELRQFVFCLPYDPPDVEITPLDADQVAKRTVGLKKGIVPAGCAGVTVGIDTGKRALHWAALAWFTAGGGHVIEYGTQPVQTDTLGTQQGLVTALRNLEAYFAAGWQTLRGEQWVAGQVWIDSGYYEHQEPVYLFCSEANAGLPRGGERYRPMKGHGEAQRQDRYIAPRRTGHADIRYIGAGYHMTWQPRPRLMLVHVNADYWKSELHNRLGLPDDNAQRIALYAAADPEEHRQFAEQLTAERQIEKLTDSGREIVTWQRIRRANHYLDAAYAACAAGDLLLKLQTGGRPGGPVTSPSQRPGAAAAQPARSWYGEFSEGGKPVSGDGWTSH